MESGTKDSEAGDDENNTGKVLEQIDMIKNLLRIRAAYHALAYFCALGNWSIMGRNHFEGVDAFGIKEFKSHENKPHLLRDLKRL